MKTRQQKEQEISDILDIIESNAGFVLLGFSGFGANDMNKLRGSVEKTGGNFRVVKRRLLNIAMKDKGVDLEVGKFFGQIAIAGYKDSVANIASALSEKSRDENEKLIFFGGFATKEKSVLEPEFIERIASLPSRDVLLSSVIGAFSASIRAFIYILKTRSEKS